MPCLGELVAWMVGWALILEYAVAASAVSVGWSGYIVGLLAHLPDPIIIPPALAAGPYAGGVFNLLAVVVALAVTGLLVIGTRESATVNAVLVGGQAGGAGRFSVAGVAGNADGEFPPALPNGWGTIGVIGAASSIFFAYVGFDAVSTAAEETRNPQRNLPIGLIASLGICTVIYLLVAAGAIGAYGAQPVTGPDGEILSPGSVALANACSSLTSQPLVCSREALAHVLRSISQPVVGNLVGLAAGLALPTVILMIFGQTRIFFVMARDGLLPEKLNSVHPRFRTPHIVTWITGIAVALPPLFCRWDGWPISSIPALCSPSPWCRWRCWFCAGLSPTGIAPSARPDLAVRAAGGRGLRGSDCIPAMAGHAAVSRLVGDRAGVLFRLWLSPTAMWRAASTEVPDVELPGPIKD